MRLMDHLIIAPVLWPLLVAALLLTAHRAPIAVQRAMGLTGAGGMLVFALMLAAQVAVSGPRVYQLGNWPSFAGIVFLADPLSVIMLLLTAALAVAALLFASGGDDRRGLYFHPLFQFQLVGLAGAFLTHDLFNLFVFFEVLLIASYGLLLHGQGGERLRQAWHYVVINLVASALFLIAVGVLYGVLGSLNMADLAARIAEAPVDVQPLVAAGGLLLMLVFGIKAALLPLYFWLPRTYAAASAPAAILFAVMTKLGLYALLRVFGALFGEDAGALAGLAWPWLFWGGAATVLFSALGALASNRLRGLLGYLVVGSAGVLFLAVGTGQPLAWAAGIYYLAHSTMAMGAFFLLADWIRRARGAGDALNRPSAMASRNLLGGLFIVLSAAAVGLPPLGGFLGKSLLLGAVSPEGQGGMLWGVVLLASFFNLIALARAGSRLFWTPASSGDRAAAAFAPALGERLALAGLVSLMLALAVLARDATSVALLTASTLQDPAAARDAVLNAVPLPTTVPR